MEVRESVASSSHRLFSLCWKTPPGEVHAGLGDGVHGAHCLSRRSCCHFEENRFSFCHAVASVWPPHFKCQSLLTTDMSFQNGLSEGLSLGGVGA